MRKKLLICICTLILALSLTACGSKEEVTYGGFAESDFQSLLTDYMTSLETLSDDQVATYTEQFESQGETVYADLFNDWAECMSVKGDLLGFKEFKLDKSGKTLTATLTADYTKRDLKLIFVYNVNKINDGPTAINVEPVYSLGETMQKAGLNTVMGILIVFCMLVVMSLIIKLFELIPVIEKKLKNKGAAKVEVNEAPVAAVETTDDLALIAVISAAIAASTGTSTDSFVVRSIKRR